MASLRVTPPFLYTASTLLPPVCALVIAARFMTRRAQRARLGWDDWLVLPALLLVFGMAAAIITGTALRSLGYPTPVASPGTAFVATSYQQTVTRKLYWIITLVQTVALSFIKVSCILFYRRVFRTGASTWVNTSLMTLLLVTSLWGISHFFGFMFICRLHFDYLWTNIENQNKCASTTMIDQALSISDVITDFLIMVFPIPLIWRLQMSTRNKLAVTAIFFCGTLAITASIARTVIIYEEISAEFQKNADEDFVSTAGLYFMFIEASFGLCTICLPTLSGALQLKGFQDFVYGFQSLFSFHSHTPRALQGTTYLHQRLGSQQSDPELTHCASDRKESSQEMELQSGMGIRVTRSFEYVRSVA